MLKHEVLLLSISFGCILIHFTREMYLGNVNIILLLLCCLSLRDFLSSKHVTGGIFLGIAILTKPYLLILFLPLLLRKKWNAIKWTILAIGVGLLLPFIFPGPLKSIDLYGDWFRSVLSHGEDFPGRTSVDYIIRLLFPGWPGWGIYVIFVTMMGLFTLFLLNNLHKEKTGGPMDRITSMNFSFEWFLLIAFLPNLIKTDWILLLFSAPLISFMVFYIPSRKRYWWIPVLVVILLFYGGNSDDLLGKSLSHNILEYGLMGLSNVFLVLVSCIMFIDYRKHIKS
jgi:hypothetical protein